MERMEKDEILRRAQKQKEDERVAQVYQRSHQVSMVVGITVCLILFLVKRIVAGESGEDVMALYFATMGASYFYRWYRLREIRDLVWACIGVVIAVIDLGMYLAPLFH